MVEAASTKFSILASYLQEHSLYKNQAAKFPMTLNSFYSVLTVSGKIQGEWWGPEAGKLEVLKF